MGVLESGQVMGSACSGMKVFVSGDEVHAVQVFFRPPVLEAI